MKLLAIVVGVVIGLAGGYVAWGVERAELAKEVVKIRAWLNEEIQRTDATAATPPIVETSQRSTEIELQRAQARTRRVEAELANSQADLTRANEIAREAAEDWRIERQRRREMESRLTFAQRDCLSGSPPAAQSDAGPAGAR